MSKLVSIYPIEQLEKAANKRDFSAYQKEPVGWCADVLGERFPPAIEELMQSIVDNEVTVAQSCNAYGKSFSASRIALWWLFCFQNSQVFITAAPPETNIRRILWAHILDIYFKNKDLFDGLRVVDLYIERTSISFLSAVTIPMTGNESIQEAKSSGKHAENLLWIGDEADGIPEPIYRGIEGCSSGGLSRQLYMFNPRAEAGAVYRMIRDRRAAVVQLSAFTHPNVITGDDVFPGAVTREKTVRRINQWCRPLVDGEKKDSDCFELPEFLIGTTADNQLGEQYPPLKSGLYKIMDPAFSYMVIGEYPSQGTNQLIAKDWIYKARARWDAYVAQNGEVPPVGTRPVMGQDVADQGDDLNVSCFRYGGFVERMDKLKWGGVDTGITGTRATDEYKLRKALQCNVDATGVGAGVAPQMNRAGCRAYRVMVASKPTVKTELGEFAQMRDQLYWEVREWLRADSGSMLPPDEELIEEAQVLTYEVNKGKIKVMDKDTIKELIKRSCNKLDALALTFYQDSNILVDELDLGRVAA